MFSRIYNERNIHLLSNCIINESKRGVYIIFRADRKWRKKIKALINIGIVADFLTDKVRIIGPGKSLIMPEHGVSELATIPLAFQIYKGYIKTSLIHEGDRVSEGSRNDFLFRWMGSITAQAEEKQKIAATINRFFCLFYLHAELIQHCK